MNKIKGFLGITAILIMVTLVISVGPINFPAQAAEEPTAELETYPIESETVAVCTPDAPGMVAYWPFNDGLGQLDDVIENPAFNNGSCSLTGCPTSNLSGKVDSAANFDGNDEVRVVDTSGLDFTVAGDITIEAWVKTTQDCSNRSVFVGRYEGDSAAAWWLGCIENNVAAFHMRDSSNTASTLASTTVINDGEWHQIVGTRDGSANENKIYVDGALENSSNPVFTGELTFTAKDVTIGFFDVAPYYWFNGTLDETALYNQALSADDVARHYLDGAGQSYCNDDLPIPGGVTFQTQKNTPLQFTEGELLVNDVAPDGGLHLVSIDPTSTNGGTITGSGPYTYTPPTDFTGTDTFNYVIADVDNDQAMGVATVQVVAAEQNEVYLPLLFKNYSP
jgi:hypothetical protein